MILKDVDFIFKLKKFNLKYFIKSGPYESDGPGGFLIVAQDNLRRVLLFYARQYFKIIISLIFQKHGFQVNLSEMFNLKVDFFTEIDSELLVLIESIKIIYKAHLILK